MLLQQSGLSYRELLNLLRTSHVKAVNPQLTLSPPFECKPSKMTLGEPRPQSFQIESIDSRVFIVG